MGGHWYTKCALQVPGALFRSVHMYAQTRRNPAKVLSDTRKRTVLRRRKRPPPMYTEDSDSGSSICIAGARKETLAVPNQKALSMLCYRCDGSTRVNAGSVDKRNFFFTF